MGNKNKSETWLPATHLRIMAFSRSLIGKTLDEHLDEQLKVSDIQKVLCSLCPPITISNPTLVNWLTGKKRPYTASVNLLKQEFPDCANWLTPDIDTSPIRRFLCALDIWGSDIDSPIRKLDTTSMSITVGKGLAILSKRWASVPITDGKETFLLNCAIPRLKCYVPRQVPDTIYQSNNPLTLMDFMFRCGSYLELTDDEFTEWAIDLASLTLIVGAFFEGVTLAKRSQSGTTGDYGSLAYRIFFRGHHNWPNSEAIREELENFSEFNDATIDYPQRLMKARDVLRKELLSIGTDLSIAELLSSRIKDHGKMWQGFFDASDETFSESDLRGVKPKLS